MMTRSTPAPEKTDVLVASTSTENTVTVPAKQQRVLACVSCQQRKIKCDRHFPCAHSLRGGITCVPASQVPRQRRRRFPERDLLHRLRHYEDLLRQNNVEFQPLHPISSDSAAATSAEQLSPAAVTAAADTENRGTEASEILDDTRSEILSSDKASMKLESKPVNIWDAISRVTLDPDDDDNDDDDDGKGSVEASPGSSGHGDGGRDFQQGKHSVHTSIRKNAWDSDDAYSGLQFDDFDHLLFGATKAEVRVSTLHPEQVHIFRLWQIYLENIDPLLKVTHTPTLQARIINAVGNLEGISPSFEALIFSIYCVSVLSLTNKECQSFFGSPRSDLLARYHFACQQSLLMCKALRSGTVESLTALYLYLVSVRSQTDPRSLSSTLATAIRAAQRLGLHDDSTYTSYNALESEMRRRLWWSLVTFDHRLCEMSDYRTTNLTPTWDCKTPLNVNDFELRPEMKNSPPTYNNPTEALFAVVRSELADFVRHSTFHINFINPSLNALAKPKQAPSADGDELTLLERNIEDKYLNACDPENPLHFMTIWTTRAFLARNRLLEHYSRLSTSSAQQTESQRNTAVSHALNMLECETKLRTSPLTKGFLWHVDSNVPALAYVHILNGLMKRPDDTHADRAWEALSDNYEARVAYCKAGEYGISDVFSRVVLQVWAAREELCRKQGRPIVKPPRIVVMARNLATGAEQVSTPQQVDPNKPSIGAMGMGATSRSSMPMPVTFGGGQAPVNQFVPGSGLEAYPEMPGQGMIDVGMDQFLNAVDWRWMHARGW